VNQKKIPLPQTTNTLAHLNKPSIYLVTNHPY